MIDKIENKIREYKIEKYFTKKYFDYFLLAFALVVVIYADWGLKETFAGLGALYLLLNPITSQSAAKIALFFLAMTPIALVFNREAKAEKLAIGAYGFLVITVIIAFFELKKEKKTEVKRD